MERQPVDPNNNRPVPNTSQRSPKDDANRQQFSKDQAGSIKAPGDQAGGYREPLQAGKDWKQH
jgi:hypothetical protein